eukprot:TRINITY_DN30691_c0_g1_i1.p1 TRINITY_DN30691_c0_g1~~TRINITY_DN30691_c0_g1_i1.p1  ORF type:complete len:179 (-),score=27.34 TRINITY_DN30691_c0_g1_i1:37-537(-)
MATMAWVLVNLLVISSLCNSRTIVETIGAPGYVLEDGPYGGNGGNAWTDGGSIHNHGPITEIEIRTGEEVDSVMVRYGTVWGGHHGGGGYIHHAYINSAKITGVTLRSGYRIDSIEFITDGGHHWGPYGGNGGHYHHASHSGCYLSYLSGSAGERLDSVTLHWDCP